MKAMDEKHLREKYAIEHDDWERTPVSVRQIVLLLGEKIEELEGHLKEIKDLKEQLNEKVTRNSENSHSPTSSDPIGFGSRRKKKPKGKKRGGQLGHPGHSRPLYPVDGQVHFSRRNDVNQALKIADSSQVGFTFIAPLSLNDVESKALIQNLKIYAVSSRNPSQFLQLK